MKNYMKNLKSQLFIKERINIIKTLLKTEKSLHVMK